MAASCCQLRVLTFNIWGLHYVDSVKIRERLECIARELVNYDIVGLQEVWKKEDLLYLARELEHILPYHHYFNSGPIGSGVCIFSRYPIMAAYTHCYGVSGSMRYFLDGEVFAGRGVLLCKILTPSGLLSFYNTHLNPRQRDTQSFELYKFVEQTRGGDPVIMTGDFNTKPTHVAYNFLLNSLDLSDVYSDDPVDTCDLTTNIYTKSHMTPKRIDFVLYSNTTATSLALVLKDRRLALTGNIPGKEFPYSDHEGVEATFQLEPKVSSPPPHPRRCMEDSKVRHFLEIADNIRAKQAPIKSTPQRVIAQWVIMGVVTFLLAPLLDYCFHDILAAYGLAWILLVLMACLGALGVYWAVVTVINGQTAQAYEANLSEIRTLLKFNTLLKVMPESKLSVKKNS